MNCAGGRGERMNVKRNLGRASNCRRGRPFIGELDGGREGVISVWGNARQDGHSPVDRGT